MKKDKIAYLAQVKITHKLKRRGNMDLQWARVEMASTGICLGTRMISNGWMKWNPDVPEEPDENTDMTRGWFSYVPSKHLHVYLVSLGPNTNPVYVLEDDIEVCEWVVSEVKTNFYQQTYDGEDKLIYFGVREPVKEGSK